MAIKTFADWTETLPGFVEVDLVAHCGWTGAGPFLYTLTLVDVATGWVSCAGLRDKRAETVLAALRRLQRDLPFTILGLDSDSGSGFLNTTLRDYCVDQHITFTRGRPRRKKDDCYVQQTNRAVVRRLLGYQRLEPPALAAVERVHELARGYVNFLHPVRRLAEKVRLGARVTRRDDTVQPPYRRLLASGVLSEIVTQELLDRSNGLDPLRLKLEIESAQRTLATRAVQPQSHSPTSVGSFIRQRPRLWSDPPLRQDGTVARISTCVLWTVRPRTPCLCYSAGRAARRHRHWRTFTDIVAFDEDAREWFTTKVASTPRARRWHSSTQSVGPRIGQIRSVAHGTTVATNARFETRRSA